MDEKRILEELNNLKALVLQGLQSGSFAAAPLRCDITLDKFFEDALNSKLKNGKINKVTYGDYISKYNTRVRKQFGGLLLCDITPEIVEQHINAIQQGRTREKICSILSGMLDKAVGKYISFNPFKNVEIAEYEEEIRRPFTLKEQKRFLKYLEGDSYYETHFLLYLKTGMRKSEIQKFDVLFDENLIHIKGTKTKASNRYIALLPDIAARLKAFYAAGRTFDTNLRNLTRAFNRICAKLKIENVCVHSLRHTFATRCYEKDMAIEEISSLLGHASAAITLRYIHKLQEFQKENARNIGKKLLKKGF